MKNIAVIFGGVSCEHDISIITGEQLIDNISNSNLYNVIPIYIDRNGIWYTGDLLKDIDNISNNLTKAKKCSILPNDDYLYMYKFGKYKKFIKLDCVIICMHGLNGEDGSLSGLFNLNKIAYSSSDLLASSVCMDKTAFKVYCKGLKINVIDGFSVDKNDYLLHQNDILDDIINFGLPIIIKPSRLGSSIGIEICEDEKDLSMLLEKAFCYDNKVLIERFVNIKKEVNIALIKNKGEIVYSNTEEPISNDKILSFDEKYRKNHGGFQTIKRIVPAEISETQLNEINDMATKIYNSLGLFGVVRFDFIIDNDNIVYINEVNTIPGSMANYLFNKNTLNYSQLVDTIISNSLHRKKENNTLKTNVDTGVLQEGISFIKK